MFRVRELMKFEFYNTVKVLDEYFLGEMVGGFLERKFRKVELVSFG